MIIDKIEPLREYLNGKRRTGLRVGLVPTMGYLHEGHLSLIRRAKKENNVVAVSIFVNPTQFAPNEDFEAYPRDIARDHALATEAGADVVFHPGVAEMYPPNSSTFVEVGGEMTKVLCGTSRPTHFRGVTTVVNMLFNIVNPDNAYFGQKDAQQAAVIEKMLRDLHLGINIVVCPIVRETSGLAMSSRNKYLSEAEKTAALVLSRSLAAAKRAIDKGQRSSAEIAKMITEQISKEPMAKIDYVSVYSYPDLVAVEKIEARTLVALAVRFGKTRLIDNIIIE
ncbi:MAG: pantoate--beta-alanine ligase [Dysgonamonadaceae bacterium]|jgi:pantoate--beta-alanine ligase|nr:pantoate--beta-alanine ligase [Dysgonamonadaceae bacterium]